MRSSRMNGSNGTMKEKSMSSVTFSLGIKLFAQISDHLPVNNAIDMLLIMNVLDDRHP